MVTMAEIVEYRRNIDRMVAQTSKSTREHVAELLKHFSPDMPKEDWEQLRAAIAQVLLGDANLGSDAVASLAADFYDAATDGIKDAGKGFVDGKSRISPEQAEGTVRRLAGHLFKVDDDGNRLEPDVERFIVGLEKYAAKRTRATGNETVSACVRKSPNKGMRYARVPTAVETCEYCYKLASQGFVYRTAATARSSGHDNCQCVAVPGTKKTEIEGYDEDEYWDRYQKARQLHDEGFSYAQATAYANGAPLEEVGDARGDTPGRPKKTDGVPEPLQKFIRAFEGREPDLDYKSGAK